LTRSHCEKKEVEKEIVALGIDKKKVNLLFKQFGVTGSNREKVKKIESFVGSEAVAELKQLLKLCSSRNVVFVPSLARGLSYYTGTVFEVYTQEISSSIGSGGRFDKMIGDLMGSKQSFPAVGCSFGLDVIVDALKKKNKKVKKSVVQVYVVPIGVPVDKVWPIVKELRSNDISADVYLKKGVTKALTYADTYSIPYVLIVGENELKKNKVMLKDMVKGGERLVSLKTVMKLF